MAERHSTLPLMAAHSTSGKGHCAASVGQRNNNALLPSIYRDYCRCRPDALSGELIWANVRTVPSLIRGRFWPSHGLLRDVRKVLITVSITRKTYARAEYNELLTSKSSRLMSGCGERRGLRSPGCVMDGALRGPGSHNAQHDHSLVLGLTTTALSLALFPDISSHLYFDSFIIL